ncbi:hypothetical protein [Rhizobium halophytocola]|uniref:Uncharacterized protein n=1 Tax=Rhizobium halophytocola TaxID=735519 RepID=A0ABS4DXH2_9HYPH|nr:hypothetical protein [Rhizobium halophytocola]MBP1850370.1 hypothetical protein [Rhizobium halophytocola]
MANIASIALSDLSDRIGKSVIGLEKVAPKLLPEDLSARYIPDPGIIGYILRDDVARGLSIKELEATAGAVAERFSPAGVKSASVLLKNGGILVGFFPIDVAIR